MWLEARRRKKWRVHIGDVAVDKDGPGGLADDLVGRNARVRAPNPQILWRMLLITVLIKPRFVGLRPRGVGIEEMLDVKWGGVLGLRRDVPRLGRVARVTRQGRRFRWHNRIGHG